MCEVVFLKDSFEAMSEDRVPKSSSAGLGSGRPGSAGRHTCLAWSLSGRGQRSLNDQGPDKLLAEVLAVDNRGSLATRSETLLPVSTDTQATLASMLLLFKIAKRCVLGDY